MYATAETLCGNMDAGFKQVETAINTGKVSPPGPAAAAGFFTRKRTVRVSVMLERLCATALKPHSKNWVNMSPRRLARWFANTFRKGGDASGDGMSGEKVSHLLNALLADIAEKDGTLLMLRAQAMERRRRTRTKFCFEVTGGGTGPEPQEGDNALIVRNKISTAALLMYCAQCAAITVHIDPMLHRKLTTLL